MNIAVSALKKSPGHYPGFFIPVDDLQGLELGLGTIVDIDRRA